MNWTKISTLTTSIIFKKERGFYYGKREGFIMTKKALSLLSDKCKEHLETLSILIKRYKEANSAQLCCEATKKLTGYLECLVDLSVITETEKRCLFTYYVK
jgi:hypothetical protein